MTTPNTPYTVPTVDDDLALLMLDAMIWNRDRIDSIAEHGDKYLADFDDDAVDLVHRFLKVLGS